MERLMNNTRQVGGVFGQPVMLGAGACDANCVSFLKGVRTDHKCRNLTGQNHNWDRIQQRISKAGHGVGCTGTRSHQSNANFTGRACITFGCMHCSLFMAYKDVTDIVLLKNLVINR